MAATTYDDDAGRLKFSEKHGIRYPLMGDIDGKVAVRLGILNEKYMPGHRAYGIPHPGMYLIDDKGVIQAKFAEVGYKDRPAFEAVIQFIKEMPEDDQPNEALP